MATRTKNPKTPKAKEKDVKKAKAQEVIQQIASMKLLGEIITWNARSETEHRHKDVVVALTEAGLEAKIARELLPRFAFSRACKALEENAVIDVVKDGNEEIAFQFTKKTMQNEEWVYTPDTRLVLNKTTGTVTCKKTDLQTQAQQLLDEAMDVRTTSDITKIVQRLFEKNADLFSIRDQGGCYFVPQEHTEFILRVDTFLKKLGGEITRFPIPAGTQYGDQAVQKSVAEAMMGIVQEHEAAVAQFTINTRRDTIEHAAEKIKLTRVKIEAYANYLQDKSVELLAAVDAANQKLTDQCSVLAKQKEEAPEGVNELFGHSVTAVIRLMGKQDWEFGEVKHALKAKGIQVADATIRAQLLAGRKGTRGEPATLEAKEIKELESLRKAAAKAA